MTSTEQLRPQAMRRVAKRTFNSATARRRAVTEELPEISSEEEEEAAEMAAPVAVAAAAAAAAADDDASVQARYKELLTKFYAQHNPDKLAADGPAGINQIVSVFHREGKLDELRTKLETKYGAKFEGNDTSGDAGAAAAAPLFSRRQSAAEAFDAAATGGVKKTKVMLTGAQEDETEVEKADAQDGVKKKKMAAKKRGGKKKKKASKLKSRVWPPPPPPAPQSSGDDPAPAAPASALKAAGAAADPAPEREGTPALEAPPSAPGAFDCYYLPLRFMRSLLTT